MIDTRPIRYCLEQIYGSQLSAALTRSAVSIIAGHKLGASPNSVGRWSERDSILIAYPDQVRTAGEAPLSTLHAFCRDYLEDVVNTIHVLPFFPASSDDGFSVIDYHAVNPQYGSWEQLHELGSQFRLMFDCVLNHASAQSAWFQGFLRNEPPFRDYFMAVEGSPDLSAVVRPRTLPLLTRFITTEGERSVWTTFGPDQVDLNYHNPEVLLAILDTILGYMDRGASFIRLDAIAYVWKQIGTACIHRPQTHWIVRFIRAILDQVSPQVSLITETNVAHTENVSYFGTGDDEAHMVYNFGLPPMVLHAFQTRRAADLAEWAAELNPPSPNAAFFNVLATHDGIGLNGARGILPEREIESMIQRVLACGGSISSRTNRDGTQSPYEMNVNYFDALEAVGPEENTDLTVSRFVTAHAILLAMQGIPGIYFHSMFGSRGWKRGAEISGQPRTVNRQKLDRFRLAAELADPLSLRSRIFRALRRLLKARRTTAAFGPTVPMRILAGQKGILGIVRGGEDGPDQILCLHNLTPEGHIFPCGAWEPFQASDVSVRDLIRGTRSTWSGVGSVALKPYQTLWLEARL